MSIPAVNPLPALCRLLREPLPAAVRVMAPGLAEGLPLLALVLEQQQRQIEALDHKGALAQ